MAHPRSWYSFGIRGLMVFVAVAAVGSLLFREVQNAREAARRSQCHAYLDQICTALRNYHDYYGSFPPAYIADAQGRPMHSWRVLILPFLGLTDLYSRYNFAEPWDGPNNAILGQRSLYGPSPRMPSTYCCPSHRDPGTTTLTSYVVVVGDRTLFPGSRCVSIADVKDGVSRTIMLVEVANAKIPWMAPYDLEFDKLSFAINDLSRPGPSSVHQGLINVAFADDSIQALRESIPPRVLKGLLTIDGNEAIDPQAIEY